jgi:hydrogenase expression/formation protein HypC
MCLAIPGKLIEILDDSPPFGAGVVEFAGVRRKVNLACVPEAREGDFVLVHAGVAITRIDEIEAEQTLNVLRELEFDDEFLDEPPSIDIKPR